MEKNGFKTFMKWLFILLFIGSALCLYLKINEERINSCTNNGGQAVVDYWGFYEKCIYGGNNENSK